MKNNYEQDLTPLSESMQKELELALAKEFPIEDDVVGQTWEEYVKESKRMDNFIMKWRKQHGV